jgi:hypothetical protein
MDYLREEAVPTVNPGIFCSIHDVSNQAVESIRAHNEIRLEYSAVVQFHQRLLSLVDGDGGDIHVVDNSNTDRDG